MKTIIERLKDLASDMESIGIISDNFILSNARITLSQIIEDAESMRPISDEDVKRVLAEHRAWRVESKFPASDVEAAQDFIRRVLSLFHGGIPKPEAQPPDFGWEPTDGQALEALDKLQPGISASSREWRIRKGREMFAACREALGQEAKGPVGAPGCDDPAKPGQGYPLTPPSDAILAAAIIAAADISPEGADPETVGSIARRIRNSALGLNREPEPKQETAVEEVLSPMIVPPDDDRDVALVIDPHKRAVTAWCGLSTPRHWWVKTKKATKSIRLSSDRSSTFCGWREIRPGEPLLTWEDLEESHDTM